MFLDLPIEPSNKQHDKIREVGHYSEGGGSGKKCCHAPNVCYDVPDDGVRPAGSPSGVHSYRYQYVGTNLIARPAIKEVSEWQQFGLLTQKSVVVDIRVRRGSRYRMLVGVPGLVRHPADAGQTRILLLVCFPPSIPMSSATKSDRPVVTTSAVNSEMDTLTLSKYGFLK